MFIGFSAFPYITNCYMFSTNLSTFLKRIVDDGARLGIPDPNEYGIVEMPGAKRDVAELRIILLL